MQSLEQKTEQLIRILGKPESAVNARQGDRVFNYHYQPEQWFELRSHFTPLKRKLEKAGFTHHFLSFADILSEIYAEHPAIAAMLDTEESSQLPHDTYNQTLQNIATGAAIDQPLSLASPIVQSMYSAIQFAAETPKSIILFTDVEMLHPLIRVSAFEQILQGKFLVPTVIFYPGKKGTVGDNPAFLGFYTSDGNYRSTHLY